MTVDRRRKTEARRPGGQRQRTEDTRLSILRSSSATEDGRRGYGAAGRADDRQLKTENRKRVKPFGRLRAGRRRKTEARRHLGLIEY